MKEKPREKLTRLGAQGLKDNELLALLLRTGYKGKNVSVLADEILAKYPLTELLKLTYGELSALKGVGKSKAAGIIAGHEFSKRTINRPDKVIISKPQDVLVLLHGIRAKQKEHFVVLYLNARNELIHKEYISIGILNASIVHPREVFAPAIEHLASSIIVAHNHPSGDTTPSEDDNKLTKRLIESGKLLGIEVLDHIIVSEKEHFSFTSGADNLFCASNE
ncbi:MAG: DNA repair protein RadC [Elusimicrobia bacterium]|nr:DNA repair protein RadC [Elusimicrobiota bacterium]MBU2614305.1 DNA repair protein RadC [Elusimicrobiota bacterium]